LDSLLFQLNIQIATLSIHFACSAQRDEEACTAAAVYVDVHFSSCNARARASSNKYQKTISKMLII
jgi:hypothetical protein